MVPLVLERVPQKISYGGKAPKTHWVLHVAFEGTLEVVQRLRQMHGLPPMPDLAALITPPGTAPAITQPEPNAVAATIAETPATSSATDTQTVTTPNAVETAAVLPAATRTETDERPSDAAKTGTLSEGPRPAIPHAEVRSEAPSPTTAPPAPLASPAAGVDSTASGPSPSTDTKTDLSSTPAAARPAPTPSVGPSVRPASGNGTPVHRAMPTTSLQRSNGARQAATTAPGPRCACGTTVTDRVAAYSRGKFGMIRCMACQKRLPAQEARLHHGPQQPAL
jgi:hypothetical protein